jgi:hypothetical protein
MSSTNTNMATPTCESCGQDKSPTYICDACCSKLNAASRAKRDQIAALEAERDELRRRLEEVVAMLEPGEMPKRTFFDFHETYMRHYSQWKLKSELHTNARAIAEGRDND